MASGTLYTYPGSQRAFKILIAAAYSGANVKVDTSFEFGKTNQSADFLKKFPLGKVPAFEDAQGNFLYESNAIARYVSNNALKGGPNAIDQALVQQYVEFAENEIVPSACTWTFPTLGFKQYNKQDTEKAQTHIKKCFTLLNDLLLSRTFLVGERVTLADITLCCNLITLYVQVLDPSFREAFGNVNRWFTTCVNQPNFKIIIGDVKLCEKMATFDTKKFQELHPKEPKKGKESKPKQEKPKEEVKKEAPVEDSVEEAVPAPKKKIDYFADVPKSSFVMDDWKRMYSNNDCDVSDKWLWEKFDNNALSFWYCEYKYNPELTMEILASNAIGGYFQRIEGLRKHAFGNLLIFKEDKYYAIHGVWLVRGQKNPFELNPDWNNDAEHYAFRKLDTLNVPEDKQCVTAYFSWEGDYFKGKLPCDGDCFK